MDECNITLPFRCNVWIHYNRSKWDEESYKCIYSATQLREVWNFFNHIDLIGGLNQFYFFTMKNNIRPIWEDKNNHGHFTIQLSAVSAEEYYYRLLALWFSKEIHANHGAVTGITIRTPDEKPSISVIAIWVSEPLSPNQFHPSITGKSPRFTSFNTKDNYKNTRSTKNTRAAKPKKPKERVQSRNPFEF